MSGAELTDGLKTFVEAGKYLKTVTYSCIATVLMYTAFHV